MTIRKSKMPEQIWATDHIHSEYRNTKKQAKWADDIGGSGNGVTKYIRADLCATAGDAERALEIFNTGQCFEGKFCGTRKTDKVFHFNSEEIETIRRLLGGGK